MAFTYLLVASAGLILAVRIVLVLFRLLSSPLRSVPGPLLARFTDVWYMWRVSKGRFELENLALHEKYGESPFPVILSTWYNMHLTVSLCL
jgi:hypothetical protein